MAKKGAAEAQTKKAERDYEILSAKLTDGKCEYEYEITKGTGLGDKHKVKGEGIFMDSLQGAFNKLNVHLAAIDDVFKHSEIEVENINNHHTDELATNYVISSFAVKGSNENQSVVFTGSKYVASVGGRMEIKTPRVTIDNLSSYKWHKELKSALELCREEVALYKEGNCTVPDTGDNEPENGNQLTITAEFDKE